MEKTPLSMRKHIAIFGDTNAGKSTLFNRLLGQDAAIVSEVKGTTTDPVTKAMELIPYGPVAVIDTAGLGDDTVLGGRRVARTKEVLSRCDLILYVSDIRDAAAVPDIIDKKMPLIRVFTKCDLADKDILETVRGKYPEAVFAGEDADGGLNKLREKMTEELLRQERDDETLIGNLLPKGSSLILVCPIDSEAPKGRLILPQVQLIRDCLDHDMKAYVTTEKTLPDALSELKRVDLVVTDSQAFKVVDEIVPDGIMLTSFSMLLAAQKGNFRQLLSGARAIGGLNKNSKILMLEGCTHNSSHEDIGRVKIPALIKKRLGADAPQVYDHYTGYNMPDDITEYDLIIQCGMCMINKKEVRSRLELAEQKGVPVTNYGISLAYLNGILDRAGKIFDKRN